MRTALCAFAIGILEYSFGGLIVNNNEVLADIFCVALLLCCAQDLKEIFT